MKKALSVFLSLLCFFLLKNTNISAKNTPTVSMQKTSKNSFSKEIDEKTELIQEFELKNGLKVLLKEDHRAPVVSQALFYQVGSRNEKAGQRGISHYLEHMQFNGTQKISKSQISQEIEKRGGNFNAGTSNDFTVYYMTLPSKHLEFVLALEADRLKNSILGKAEAEREKEVVITELYTGDNNPASLLSKKLLKKLYPNHSYGHPVIGWEEDLRKITEKDLQDFYRLYYRPSNAVLVLVGDFDSKEARSLIEKHFANLSDPKDLQIPKVEQESSDPLLFKTNSTEQYVKLEKESQTSLIRFAWRIPSLKDPDFLVLKVISSILSDGYLSRLEKKLIDTGKASYVKAFEREGIDPFSFNIIASTPKKEMLKELEELIVLEIKEIIENGVSEEELERVKAKAETDFWFDLEDSSEMAMQLGFFESVAGDWRKTFSWTRDLRKVSSADVQRVSKKYLSPERALIGLLVGLDSKAEQNPAFSKEQQKEEQEEQQKVDFSKREKALSNFYTEIKEIDLPEKEKVQFEELELKNGLKVVLRADRSLPIFGLSLTVDAGEVMEIDYQKARKEQKEREFLDGTSTLTAMMLERGTENYTREELNIELEKIGALIETSAEKNYVSLEARGRAEDLTRVLKLIAEELRRPTFPKEELELTVKQLLLRLEQRKDNLGSLASINLNQLIYPKDHSYYEFTLEEQIQSLSQIKTADLKKFHQKYYQPSRVILSISGDFKRAELLAALEESFGTWQNKSQEQLFEVPLVKLAESEKRVVGVPGKVQAVVMLGHAGQLTRSSEDYYALALANDILGGGSSLASRLGAKIREEQGLVYSIYSAFSLSRGAGPFIIKLGIAPEKIDYALKLVKEELARFIEEGVSEEELARAKNYRTGAFLSGNLMSNEDLANALNSYLIWNLPLETINLYSQKINLVSRDDIKRVSAKYFSPEKLQLVICKPLEK